MFYKMGVLKKFALYSQENACNFIKGHSVTGVFLWVLRNFYEHLLIPPVVVSVSLLHNFIQWKLELSFCTCSNTAQGVPQIVRISDIGLGWKKLWHLSLVNHFEKQIIIIIHFSNPAMLWLCHFQTFWEAWK